MININPYEKCPVYETDNFILRFVQETDAENLLECYSDLSAVKFMNSDNCNTDFHFNTIEDMKKYISFWLMEYRNKVYVRFSIIDKTNEKAIGTIEIFSRKGPSDRLPRFGVLRIDLHSKYEKKNNINELLRISRDHFFQLFEVEHIITKAIPEASERVSALIGEGFRMLENNSIVPYDDYYISAWEKRSIS